MQEALTNVDRTDDSPVLRIWGQLVDRRGQPAAGIGMVLFRQRDGAALANTVSDSAGAFVLPFRLPQAKTALDRSSNTGDESQGVEGPAKEPEFALDISVNEDFVPIPGLRGMTKTFIGPYTIVVDHAPTVELSRVAPKPQFLGSEEDLLQAIKLKPELFTRPRAARGPNSCSPYSPLQAPARVFYVSQYAAFPGKHTEQGEEETQLRSHISRETTSGTNWTSVEMIDSRRTSGSWQLRGVFRFGTILRFRQEWWDVGLSLGDLLYSVPLAPCEDTKVATVDWRRRDYATKRTALDEASYQDTTISRLELINETVRLGSTKSVSDSTLGGGFGASFGPITAGAAGALETVSGAVDATTSAARDINDRIKETSNVVRSTRSFSVAEVSQEEETTVRTRTIRNHNHCHTVTFQYYEVLQNYLVKTQADSVQPAILVSFRLMRFDDVALLRYGYLLRRALLDSSLVNVLDTYLGVNVEGSAENVQEAANPQPAPQGAEAAKVAISIGAISGFEDGVFWTSHCKFYVNDKLVHVQGGGVPVDELHFDVELDAPLKPADLSKLAINCESGSGPYDLDDVTFSLGEAEVLYLPTLHLEPGRRWSTKVTPPADTTLASQTNTRQHVDMTRLLEHLNANAAYYTYALIQGGDAGLRYLALDELSWNGHSVAEVVDNVVLGYLGDSIVLPLKSPRDLPEAYWGTLENRGNVQLAGEVGDDRIVTIPSAGVFAESQLGECSACETIDDTRFWDWQKSPCPGEAPAITEGMLASRYQDARDLVAAVKSDLVPQQIQIPQEPEPMIKIGDQAMSELVKNLDLKGTKDVLDFVKGLSDTSAANFRTIAEIAGKFLEGGAKAGASGATGGAGAAAGEGAAGAAGALEGTAGMGDVLGEGLAASVALV